MSRPIHPIRKLAYAVERRTHGEADTVDVHGIERDIARHIKPLLDALEESDAATEHQPYEEFYCRFCNLLAAWRAKL